MLTLKRKYKSDETNGILTLPDGYEIETIELPWKKNKIGESCIPEGVYLISRDHTGRHKWFKVNDVPNRTFIEIHQATSPSQLLGCIGIKKESDLKLLVDWFGEHEWVLRITR